MSGMRAIHPAARASRGLNELAGQILGRRLYTGPHDDGSVTVEGCETSSRRRSPWPSSSPGWRTWTAGSATTRHRTAAPSSIGSTPGEPVWRHSVSGRLTRDGNVRRHRRSLDQHAEQLRAQQRRRINWLDDHADLFVYRDPLATGAEARRHELGRAALVVSELLAASASGPSGPSSAARRSRRARSAPWRQRRSTSIRMASFTCDDRAFVERFFELLDEVDIERQGKPSVWQPRPSVWQPRPSCC